MRLSLSYNLNQRSFAGLKVRVKGAKQSKKELEANYNHLGLVELYRKGKSEEFLRKGELLSHLILCSAHVPWLPAQSRSARMLLGCGWSCRPELCDAARPPRAARLCCSIAARRLSLPAIQRQGKKSVLIQSISYAGNVCWKNSLILDLNLPSSLYRNTASLWQSWQHKTDFIQFQLNTVPSGSLRIWSLVCG